MVSMSDMTSQQLNECYDLIDTLEQRQTDAMAVGGDISDFSTY